MPDAIKHASLFDLICLLIVIGLVLSWIIHAIRGDE
jgi:hypothetical protein